MCERDLAFVWLAKGQKSKRDAFYEFIDKKFTKDIFDDFHYQTAEIIMDNTQLTIFGGFAPNSSSTEVQSKSLGSRTVMTGSVNRGKKDPSQSLQMIYHRMTCLWAE